MKLAVQENQLSGQSLDRSLGPSKKRRQRFSKTRKYLAIC